MGNGVGAGDDVGVAVGVGVDVGIGVAEGVGVEEGVTVGVGEDVLVAVDVGSIVAGNGVGVLRATRQAHPPPKQTVARHTTASPNIRASTRL